MTDESMIAHMDDHPDEEKFLEEAEKIEEFQIENSPPTTRTKEIRFWLTYLSAGAILLVGSSSAFVLSVYIIYKLIEQAQ